MLFLILTNYEGGVTTSQIEFPTQEACNVTLRVMLNERFKVRGHYNRGLRIEKGYCINTNTGEVINKDFGYNGKMLD